MNLVINGESRTFPDSLTVAALLESLGHRVEPVVLPIDQQFVDDFILYWSMLVPAVTRGGKVLYDPSFDASKLTPVTLGLAAEFSAGKRGIVGAIRRLRASTQVWEDATRSLDVVLTPTVAHLPPELGHLSPQIPYDVVFPRVIDWLGYPPLTNANGAPSISAASSTMGPRELLIRMAPRFIAASSGAPISPRVRSESTR